MITKPLLAASLHFTLWNQVKILPAHKSNTVRLNFHKSNWTVSQYLKTFDYEPM